VSGNESDNQPEDDMQRPEPETPDSPSSAGDDLDHFTDWREQLRDRVKEIRARKLADKRGEDSVPAPEPDPAEQAAAARAEKLRAAREAIEGTRPEPAAGMESARIEQRIEAISEEVAEDTIDEAVEEAPDALIEAAAEAEAEPDLDTVLEAEVEAEVEAEAEAEVEVEASADLEAVLGTDVEEQIDEIPLIAAQAEVEPETKLGSRDRSARRSEIADVVDSLLGPLGETSADEDAPEVPEEIDLDALFGHSDPAESPEALEATADSAEETATEEDSADQMETPIGSNEIDDATGDVTGEATGDADEVELNGVEADPFASAPAWARASFAPRDPQPTDEADDAAEEGSIPPELEDVAIPAWAMPRGSEPREQKEDADLPGEDEDAAAEIEFEGVSPVDMAVQAIDSLDEEPDPQDQEAGAQHGPPEVDEEAETQDIELDEIPAEAPVDADLFAPEEEEEAEAVELFAAQVDSSPLPDLLASAEEPAAPETEVPAAVEPEAVEAKPDLEELFAATEPELVAETEVEADIDADLEAEPPQEIEPEIERELEHSMASAIEAATASVRSQTPEPAASEPEASEPEVAEPEPAEVPQARPAAAVDRAEGDVFLLGEFRSRGRLTRYESRQAGDAAAVSGEPGTAAEPEAASARKGVQESPDPQDGVTTAPIDLFEEADPEAETDTAEIEWDLDTPGDPDVILDAQRGDADPSAPVADRVFSVMADAMVLLTIAALLAIAGARAANVPVVPFVEAAPLPFVVAVLLFGFAYGVFFTGTCGQTLGKMAMRVRVIGSDSFRVGYRRAAQRVLYYTVAALPAGLGLLPALRDPEHRALHDRMSNTRVVKA